MSIPGKPASIWVRMAALISAVVFSACGGNSQGPSVPAAPTPSPTPATVSAPTPTPSPESSPVANAKCGSLPQGPVTRLTVAPREHDADGRRVAMRVRVRAEFTDEVLCVDKDKDHKIDFNLNQRNDEGKECCWEGEPGWAVRDPGGWVTTQQTRDENGFIFRIRISPRGARGRVGVSAELDGVESNPWQSGTGEYQVGPLWVEAMDADELQSCNCVYIGNGGYQGAGCVKAGY